MISLSIQSLIRLMKPCPKVAAQFHIRFVGG